MGYMEERPKLSVEFIAGVIKLVPLNLKNAIGNAMTEGRLRVAINLLYELWKKDPPRYNQLTQKIARIERVVDQQYKYDHDLDRGEEIY